MIHSKDIITLTSLPKKIGVFDSGIGGFSILNKLINTSVSEFIYIADTAYLPYGEKTPETLIERGKIVTDLFLNYGITTVIVACHTSSATALPTLKVLYPQVTFIDMLAPTITAALKTTHNKKIGVFATAATIKNGIHKRLLHSIDSSVIVVEQACPQLVPLIENQNSTKTEQIATLNEYLAPMIQENIDTLILGCTHYAFLEDLIHQLIPKIQIISAHKEAEKLFNTSTKNKADITFFVSGDIETFKQKTQQILNTPANKTYATF